ncbi:MAG: tetratricopeptide repeat protein, partial [Deltaproteobacteria bacterium]|nr:tetratricopeptide repeat protein [Deltaproteobacteria bacterium]
TREQTGLSPEELERRPVKLTSQQVLVRTFDIKPPRGFVAAALPESRSMAMGPSKWTEAFLTQPDGTVEATFRFETGATDFGPSELAGFRKAYWDMVHEAAFNLTFSFEPVKLMDEGKAAQATALLRKLLQQNPKDGALRARYAKMLLNYRLGDLARREIEQAVKDSPSDAFVQMVQAAVARSDSHGIIHAVPYDRAKAIQSLRAAVAASPTHSWARQALAEELERNVYGEETSRRSVDLDEAATLYEQLVNDKVSEVPRTRLLDLYLRNRRFEEILSFKSRNGDNTNDLYGRVAEVEVNGVHPIVQEVRNASRSPQDAAKAAIVALSALSYLRDYAKTDALAAALEPELPDGSGTALRKVFSGIKVAPLSKDLSSPEAATRSTLSLLANGETPTERAQQLAELASVHGRTELTGKPSVLGSFGQWATATASFGADALLSKGKCEIDGKDGVGYRARCSVEMGALLTASFYWVREKGQLRLESVGGLRTLAENAWLAAKAGRPEDAALWLNWWSERLEQLGLASNTFERELFRGTWPPRGALTRELALMAAAQALVFMDFEKAPREAVEALDAGRQQLTGQRRRLADRVVSAVFDARKDWDRAIAILKPLAESEGEDSLLVRLAGIYLHAARYREAHSLIDQSLRATPADAQWLEAKAFALGNEGRYPEAVAVFEKLAQKNDDLGVLGNLVWYRYMDGRIDEETEKKSNRTVAIEQPTMAALHNTAAVLIARGKLPRAAEVATRRMLRLQEAEEGWDAAQWHLHAVLLQALGFEKEARAAWAKVTEEDPDFAKLKKRALTAAGR